MKRETGRRAFICCILVAMSLFAAGFTHAREIAPDEKMLWSCYMICWSLNRDYRGFYDRPLDRPPRDGSNVRLVDLRRAMEAGVDALSVDLFIADKNALPAFAQLVKLINEYKLPIQLSPMFDGLADPGLTADDVAAKVQQWFERFAQEPCVVRTGGRPVIFSYGASELPPERWQGLFQRLRAAGCEGHWIAEISHHLSVGQSPDFERARPWLDLFPAANSFNVHKPERAAELVRRYQALYPAGRTWVAPVSLGYWRPEIAVYTSQNGTALFRGTWQAIIDSKVRWVQQSTWNDFSENHQIMPSENYGTTFVELNRYLAAQWKGGVQQPDRPRLYLSQQQEVQVGETVGFELLAIVRGEDLPSELRLVIHDSDGRRLHAFAEAKVGRAGLQSAEFLLPVGQLPPGRLLVPEAALLDGHGKSLASVQGPYTIVTPGGYQPERNHSWLHTSDQMRRPALSCTMQLGDRASSAAPLSVSVKPAVKLHVESPAELADVELLHDGRQIVSLRRDVPEKKLSSPVEWEGNLPVTRRGTVGWGTYAVRAITLEGQMATSRPIFVERPAEAGETLGHWTFDADSDQDVLDSSPWLHDGRLGGRPRRKPWFPAHVADSWGGKCLAFDGVDDRILLEGPIVPTQAFTVECWIKPAANTAPAPAAQILFASASAAVVLSLNRDGHLQVTRKCDDRWRGVTDRAPITIDQWQHVAATYDGSILRLYRQGRLVGEQSAPGAGKSGQVAIGYNSVTNQGFYRGCLDEVRLSARALRPDEFGPHSPLRESQR